MELSADPDPALEAMCVALTAYSLLRTLTTNAGYIAHRKPEKRARYVDAYNRMLALVPGFRDTLTELSDTNELEGFIGMVRPSVTTLGNRNVIF